MIFHLSPTGDDTTPEGPWATLAGARDALRQLRASGTLTGHATVELAPGTYPLAETVSFTPADSHTTYRASSGSEAVIDGGRVLSGLAETTHEGLRAWILDLPEVASGKWHFRSLFADGMRRPRARLPKFSPDAAGVHRTFRIGEIRFPDKRKLFDGDHVFKPLPGDVQPWPSLRDAEIVLLHYWVETRLPQPHLDPRTVWVSFAARVPATGGQPGVHLARDASTPVAGVRLTNSSGQFSAIRNGAATGTGTLSPAGSVLPGTDYFVLARFVMTNASGNATDGWGGSTPGTIAADVWFYPLASPPSESPAGTGTANYPAQSDGTGTRLVNGVLIKGSSAASGLLVDEVRVGTTFEQVAANPVDAAPGQLSATATGPGRIDLAWTDYAANETGYVVEGSSDSNSWNTLATLDANTTTFSETGLPASATRFYRVAAANAAGLSGYAGPVFATTWDALTAWRQGYFGTISPTGTAADAFDHDGDGLPNLLEYALGGDPTSATNTPGMTVAIDGSARLTLSFTPQVVAGLRFIVEASPDLSDWSNSADISALLTPGQPHTFIDPVTLGGAVQRRFLRLRVTVE